MLFFNIVKGSFSFLNTDTSGDEPEDLAITSNSIVGIYNRYNNLKLEANETSNLTWNIQSGTLPDYMSLQGDYISGELRHSLRISNPDVDFKINITYDRVMENKVFNSFGDGTKSWSIQSGTLPNGIILEGSEFSGYPNI